MDSFKQTIETKQITDNLTHKISISGNESDVYLIVKYNDGKLNLLVEKTFRNNYLGLEQLSDIRQKFSTEQYLFEYLGISKGENNE